ncbi:erythromycin resistance leader peptide [Corynebacterium striatum]|uniref:Leader peptide of Erm(X) n=9 Tax=Actinomycetes TaxID=1760 RepID=D6CJE9_CORRG|nr:ErmLP [Corynebacterium striatum]AAK28909.1 putative leader peptide [Corynebacterium jeikeium]AAM12764.1 23S rRNA adenine N-6-methyltransferase leader peptide [Corynebacterium diphtheriae]ABG26480.1 leader peptide [Corynebacterium urealyticum DSM 7109]AQM44066.1 hypothetical protein BBL520_07035 [Bifidobacterium breve]MBS9780759.1 erythromycin resistance leader peptide [Corynebacteriaceae bacterium]MCH4841712.1 erythromycin resistance leader peptide [Bifidobacterium pseudolongum]MCQ4617357
MLISGTAFLRLRTNR